jgi:molecular chaperone DnaK (HSP70)
MSAGFFVGIDLGTSNTVVASATEDGTSTVEGVMQRTSASTLEALPLFPSCAFAGLPGEVEPSDALSESDGWLLGDFAKRRGAEVPERLISSSKSWLCHPRVDKHAPILPWGSGGTDEVPKLSPVDVATKVLAQVRRSWDASHPDAPLAEQHVVLTVPASFDEVARELTLEAAQRAGLSVRLLEEPQAAFYDAMARGELAKLVDRMRAEGRSSANVLVCDLGGGTTDLSLLGVTFEGAEPEVTRLAVGNHLLLGGDNMDLALAHLLEPRLSPGEKLEPREFTALVYAARRAKEALLSGNGPDEHKITLLGRGSNLLGGQKRATLTREEATRVVIDGFLPLVEPGPIEGRARAGLVALGLPYERDVAVTRHIAAFIHRHVPTGTRVDALLLNGGVFRAGDIRDAVKRAIAHLQGGAAPFELAMDDPDTSVAKGAALFARALQQGASGKRISGGAARSYFIRVGKSERGRPLAVCAIPKGSEEGIVQRASETRLKLLVGKPARFDLYSSDNLAPATGEIVEVDEAEMESLPPLVTVVSADGKGELEVVLEAELTPVGTLEIHCVEAAGSANARRFRLAFDLRTKPADSLPPPASLRRPADRGMDEALAAITKVYGKGTQSDARDAKNLQRELERLLGDREAWSADTSRALADRLIEHIKGRRRTLDHERVFFQLTGYCLRPGFGAPGDDERCAKMAPLFAERLAFPKEARSWQQLFICFRRIAAGLSEADQLAMRNDLDPFIAPSELKLKKPKTFKPESSDYEILELLAHLEHVPPARRADLGSWILERTWTKRDPRLWAAIGRLGARVPAYASAHRVTSPVVAEKWLDQLLADKWADLASAPRAASDMARMTGDRARDVSPSMRERVATRLEKESVDAALVRAVREVVEVVRDERATFFGERLPSGLRL